MIEDDSTDNFHKLMELIPNDKRKQKILNYYYHHERWHYLEHIIKALEILKSADENKKFAYNVIKTTRAGYTTNSLLAALILNKSIVIVEPTNAIAYETVKKIMDIYVEATGDDSKIVRQIPSNRDGCSEVVEKLENSKILGLLPYIIAGNCEKCHKYGLFTAEMFLPKATKTKCTIKTMLYEKLALRNDYKPDVITVTYDKLLTIGKGIRGEFYADLIKNADIIIFDELGYYLSKCETGLPLTEKRTSENNITIKNLEDDIKKLEIFISEIENDYHKIRFTQLLRDYITPWMEKSVVPALSMPRYPKFLTNSLYQEFVSIKVKKGPINKRETMSKNEALTHQFGELHDSLEIMLNDEKNNETILFLLKLLDIMTYKKYVIYKLETLEFLEDEEIKVKSVNVVGTTDEIINRLEKWLSKKQVTILTDATMPTYSFDTIKRKKVIDVYFGDPAHTNASLLIANDKKIQTFSVIRWHKNFEYKMKIIDRLTEIIQMVGGHNIVVWCPNIKIQQELMYYFEGIKCNVCTHENEEPSSIMFTYYNSTLTRGVESDRRIQILLGKANKPVGSFRHIAYMQRLNWNVFDDMEVRKMAEKSNLTIDEYKKLLTLWSKEFIYKNEVIKSDEMPKALEDYFENYSNAIQKEKTFQDSWQAGSRAKDSLAITRSMLICMGWKDADIWEMLKWGGIRTQNIKYNVHAGTVQKMVKKQNTIIPAPNVIKLNFLDEIIEWMNDGALIPQVMGFDVDLQSGILNMLMYMDSVTLEEVWMELGKNLNIGHDDENWQNGYLIGAVNCFKMWNDFGKDIAYNELENGNYVFTVNKTQKPEINGILTFYELDIIIKILKIAFIIKKDKISFADIRNKIRHETLTNKEISDGLVRILSMKILKGSTWEMRTIQHKNRNEIFIVKGVKQDVINRIKRKVIVEYSDSKLKRDIFAKILDWYESDNELELHPQIITKEVAHCNVGNVKDVLMEFKERGWFEEFGMNCKIMKDDKTVSVIRSVVKL